MTKVIKETPTLDQSYLTVPGTWLRECGKGDKGKTFLVLYVESYGEGRTFATVADGSNGPWQVWVEERKAIFRSSPNG